MREKVIALIVCLIIFVGVVIIGVSVAARSSAREKDNEKNDHIHTRTVATEHAEQTVQKPAKPEKTYRFKRTDRVKKIGEFDFSTSRRLPKSMAQYRYTAGILVDLDSRKVLWQQNSNTPVPIASLTKLLTIYTAFEELERNEDIDLKTRVTVSLESAAEAKIKMNLKPGDKIPLNDLFIYAMLRSANDAAHLIAEYFGRGEIDLFIKKMNRNAYLSGMTDARFYNANGLPIYGKRPEETRMNQASCLDMVKLIDRIYDYPAILHYTSMREANTPYGVIRNGNRLLSSVQGMEGLKTGYTNAAGNCLAFSCRRNGRRLAGIVTGFANRQKCFDFTAKLLDWGFRSRL